MSVFPWFGSITTDEKFYFTPATDSTEVLEVDRLNFELKLISMCHCVYIYLYRVTRVSICLQQHLALAQIYACVCVCVCVWGGGGGGRAEVYYLLRYIVPVRGSSVFFFTVCLRTLPYLLSLALICIYMYKD